jgi:hypothetical protein
MAVFLITGAIIGILLGLRFKVLVLVPASVLAALAVIINGSADKLSLIVLTLLGTLVSLQVGYITGSVIRFLAQAYLPAWMRDRCSGTKC